MTAPTVIDIPHTLGRAEVKRRMDARIGELPGHLPGGIATVETAWSGEDRMAVDATAIGQRVAATIDVEETRVRISLLLPPALSFMAGTIAAAVRAGGEKLLLPGSSAA